MARPLIDAQFYDTYRFVGRVHEILGDLWSHLQLVNDFNCDGQHFAHSAPFPRYSALHGFLEFVIRVQLIEDSQDVDLDERRAMLENFKEIPEALEDLDPCTLPIEQAMRYYDLDFDPFTDWLKGQGKSFEGADEDDIYEYLNELQLGEAFDSLLMQSVRETFYVLFGNRGLLLHFNHMMAQELQLHAKEAIPEEYAANFAKPGVLRRVAVPEWVKRAVFFRDRGRCISCDSDLTGLVSIWSDDNYDHVIPLAAGGLNDATNIQLLCGDCNRKKGHRNILTSTSYEDWYPFARRDE